LCIVELERGIDIGTVIQENTNIDDKKVAETYPRVLRKATEKDIRAMKRNREKEVNAYKLCLKKIAERNMPMKLVSVRYVLDRSKIIFYFTAEGRVDFRELVRDLAHHFKTRIELHQIGVRDEAKLFGGYSWCGRELCCKTFLKEFDSVTIKMAKEQNLILTPSKISGVCGRLMCCLAYEYEYYANIKQKLPKEGTKISIDDNIQGVIAEINVIKGQAKILFPDDRAVWLPIEDIKKRG
jgi:cell fate regulator YaaT (PSP1 superfamily)